MGRLEGKVAIVTGGGQGIGKGIALAMAKQGAKVAIAELNPKTCEEAAKEIRQLGKEALGIVCNVGDNEQVKRMVKEVVTKFHTVDILVNNAQSFHETGPVEKMQDQDFDLALQTGVKATWYTSLAVFPYMKDRGGKIINFGSGAGIWGINGLGPYNAAKEGIRGLTRTMAREWGKYKININVICPNAGSPAAQAAAGDYDVYIKRAAIPRWGDPEKDIGGVAVFLASEDADFVTGQTLNVDGGNIML